MLVERVLVTGVDTPFTVTVVSTAVLAPPPDLGKVVKKPEKLS